MQGDGIGSWSQQDRVFRVLQTLGGLSKSGPAWEVADCVSLGLSQTLLI